MAFESGTAYPESDVDADDEYEHSIRDSSPIIDGTDDEASDTENEGMSSQEHTPTTYGKRSSEDQLPETIITEWTMDECADFVGSLGLRAYADQFLENEIVGEALIALQHEDLKQMGVSSVGHRLTILKSVYEIKIKQDIEVESDHYVPLSADAEAQYATATLKDIKQLVDQLRIRDERMSIAEKELQRITEEYKRLREELLPVFRRIKESEQPLPYPAGGNTSSHGYGYDASSTLSPPVQTPSLPQSGSGLSRKFSTKQFFLGSTPKNASPTAMQHGIQERSLMEQALDPAGAAERAVLSSSHLAAMNGSQGASSPGYSPGIPSPSTTSPPITSTFSGSTLASRSYRSDLNTPQARNFPQDDTYTTYKSRDSMMPPSSARRAPTPAPASSTGSAAPDASVEIFKSFRVSMEDPCYKVLPAALKKYNINAPADQYALYIVYGNEERCLQRDEKPLILFKQLDKEGKKPMFMLRKTGAPDAAQAEPGSAGLQSTFRGQTRQGYDMNPPGGII